MSARLDDLGAMRELLWTSLSEAEPDKRAPLFSRLESVIEQIDRLSPNEKAGDPVDEIAKRRASRGAGSTSSTTSTETKRG